MILYLTNVDTEVLALRTAIESLPEGFGPVRAAQPLGILALALLEPQSDDGLVTWNLLDPWLQVGAPYPILRVPERITTPLRRIRDN